MYKASYGDCARKYQGSYVLLSSFMVVLPRLLKMKLVLGGVMNICGSYTSGWILKPNTIFQSDPLALNSFIVLFHLISPENQGLSIGKNFRWSNLLNYTYPIIFALFSSVFSFLLLLLLSRTLPTHHSAYYYNLLQKKNKSWAKWQHEAYVFPSPFFGGKCLFFFIYPTFEYF